jgi:outer membrane protein insertion porin family
MLIPALSPALAAQEARINYEGQHVASIDISAGPAVNTDALQPIVMQKAGEPYSQAKIDASIAALKQTGEFTGVTVQMEPVAAGLHVTFVLEPAYYIGVLSFPGAEKTFPYTRLLQTANMPAQQPFLRDQIERSRTALMRFFANQGFFQATVEGQAQTDEQHKIVNVIFNVILHKRAKVGAINFTGISTEEADGIRGALGSIWARLKGASIRAGKPYTAEHAQASIPYIQAHLRKEGHLTPQVRLQPREYHPETNRADVSFQVTPGPMIEVKVTGARMLRRTIKKLVPIYEENAYDRDLIEEGKRNLEAHFQQKGFFDVSITAQVNEAPDKVSVVYAVQTGSKHRVERIDFEGNNALDDDVLRPKLKIEARHFLSRGSYSQDLLKQSSNAIIAAYRDAGFAAVKVTPRVQDFDPDVDVTFQIIEGPRDVVDNLYIAGNAHISNFSPRGGSLQLAPSKPYSTHGVEQDRNQILAMYLDRGYTNAAFDAQVTPSDQPHHFNVTYKITEGPQVRISGAVVLGRHRAQLPPIERAIKLQPGEPMSEGKLLRAEGSLYELGMFDWAEVGPKKPITTQQQEDVLVKVHEAKRNSIDYGVGFEVVHRGGNIPIGAVALPGLPVIGLGTKFTASQQTFVGPRGSIEYTRRQMRGRPETFTIALLGARLEQRAQISYSDMHFRGTNWTSLASIVGERNTENPIFAATIGQATFQMQRSLNADRTRTLLLRYTFQKTELSHILIPDLVLPEDRSVRLSTISGSLVRDTRDKPLDAHKGMYQTLDVGITAKALGSQTNFARIIAQTSYYREMRPWLVWANNVRVGFAMPFAGGEIPLSERFFSGGSTTLRGFPINGAGPQRPVSVCTDPSNPSTCTVVSVPVGGNMLFILNSELRFPIPIRSGLGGAVFYDGGNVYSRINFKLLGREYTNSVGFGLRYNTPVGPLRIDIGRLLSPIPGVKATQYFITLGQAF